MSNSVTVDLADFLNAASKASSSLASGWSEAATKYTKWLRAEEAVRIVPAAEKLGKVQAELSKGFAMATSNAAIWSQAARDAGKTGIAVIIDKYALRFAAQAEALASNVSNAQANLNAVAADIKFATEKSDGVMGGKFGKAIGPAFDAYQMMDGMVEWASGGRSDKFGGAAMGVVLSAGFGLLFGLAAGAMIGVGLPVVIAAGVGAVIGSALGDAIFASFRDSLESQSWFNTGIAWIGNTVNANFLGARNVIIRSDPLVLDLDGDGLELSAASGNILFDHNADSIKTGTGWAKPDDGFLVRDIDGNGTIDSGRELFGIDTLKSNGALATQGFDALKDLDSNNDGFMTSADTAFAQLKVWQDANQDGISQSAELKTLAQLGITSIGLNGTATGPQAGQILNNNKVALSAGYTRNGVIRTVGAIDLETNNFFTEFPSQVIGEAGNPVAISGQAQALPQMNGSGMVRNLRAGLSSGLATIDASNEYIWRVAA